ncbi:PIN domain-containing protein [bacterium]|nr:PIN domain-containing protein [bacterium]
MSHILDTDTYIYLTQGNKNIFSKIKEIGEENIFLSAITVAELYYGAFKSKKVSENSFAIQKNIEKLQILNFTKSTAKIYGRLKATLNSQGMPIDDMDLEIASIAISHGYTLVTHNQKHFKNIAELLLEDWFE